MTTTRKISCLALFIAPCLLLLAGCATTRQGEAVSVLSQRGGKLSLLEQTRNPVLVVKSKKGIGRARLRISRPLPEGMMVEFPGLTQLEYFSLERDGKRFTCHGTAEPEQACTFGEEWPVGSIKRYPSTMTVNLPAAVFTAPGEWALEWVDYYRN